MDKAGFEAAVISLLETTQWSFINNDGKVEASFTRDEILLPETSLPFLIAYDVIQGKLSLTVMEEDGITTQAVLEYVRNKGAWFGRGFQKGYVQITPLTNRTLWEKVLNPAKFMQGAPIKKVAGTLYADQIYTDYKIPAFDIRTIPGVHYKTTSKNAIALIACIRLGYFTKTVQALALTPESTTWPIFLFLDFPTDSSCYKDNLAHVEVMKSFFPDAVIIQRPCNFGAGKNIIDARRQLFDYLGFEYVYLLEDDIIIAPNCLTILESLWNWVTRNTYTNIGVVQGWWLNTKREPSTYVDISVNELLGYSMSKRCWDDIKPIVYEYEQKFLFSRYHERPHKTIGNWFDSLPTLPIQPGYPIEGERFQVLRGFMGSVQTSQQWTVLIAMYKKGWLRIHPKINLCENIGRSGLGKVGDFDNMKYSEVHIQDYPSIVEFEETL